MKGGRTESTPGSSLVYGRRPVAEVLRATDPVSKVWIAWGAKSEGLGEIQRLARERDIPVELVSRERLDQLAGAHHQGVVAWVAPARYLTLPELLDQLAKAVVASRTRPLARGKAVATKESKESEESEESPARRVSPVEPASTAIRWPPFVLVLDEIQDPHNFGALLRTAEATGVDAVVIPEHRAVGLTDVVAKTSAGAQQWVTVARVGSLTQALREFKRMGLWVIGSAGQASQLAYEADLTGPLALVIGSEGSGLRNTVASACDLVVRLPMLGHVESLNASVAGAILLYEVVRQRMGRTYKPEANP